MNASAFAAVGTDLVTAGRLTYAGYSASVCVVAPDFEGIHPMHDPDALAQGYPAGAQPAALGWLPWRVVPHWDSDHKETETADLAVDYLLKAELPFRTLRDGHAIVVDDTETRLVGRS